MAAAEIDAPMSVAPQVELDNVFEGRPTCSEDMHSDDLNKEIEEVITASREPSPVLLGNTAPVGHLRSAAAALPQSDTQDMTMMNSMPHTIGQHKKDGAYTLQGGHSVRIPRSAWGVAAIMPIVSEVHSCGDWFRVRFLSYFCLALSAGTQIAFVVGIKSIIVDDDVTCDNLAMHASLVLLCLVIYMLSVLNDIEETFDLAEVYFDMVPTVSGRSQVLFFDEDGNVATGGFSFIRKSVLAIVVLLLKFGIGVLLGYHGTVYLASSATDDELLLNTLALEFVLNVDEMIYASLAPMSTRSLMLQIPPFRTQRRRAFFRWVDAISPIFKVMLCFFASRWAMFVVNPATAACIPNLSSLFRPDEEWQGQ